MGADMCAATVWLAHGTEPDWPAAEKALAELTCPAEGFPKGHQLNNTLLEDQILCDYEMEEANTDKKRKEILDGILAGALAVFKGAVNGERRDLTWSTHAGWDVYITGGLTSGDVPTDCYEAISNLDGTGILEAAGFNTRPKTVVVVVLESDYDTTVQIAADQKAAEQIVAAFCREFWDQVVFDPHTKKTPESDFETIEKFFAHANGSWSEIRKETRVDHLAL